MAQNTKQRLKRKADRLFIEAVFRKWGNLCEITGKLAQTAHHFFPKGLYPQLRYDLNNGVPISNPPHFKHHHLAEPTIHQTIIEKRGRDWYRRLKKKSKEKLKPSYQTVQYYEDIIKKLEKC